MELLVSLISGAVGGNIAGGLLKNQNLGLLGNSITGVIGGGLVYQLLSMIGTDLFASAGGADGGIDPGLLTGEAAAGGIGGAAVMLIISTLRNLMTR
jgi:uncharacterized membrane protein YeaQ/YmgE (transglycosylase-associated protein family)